ncbi:hypothetical protein TNCT_138681 [Trichonephila clavata]|uniref:Uncharacterized protein n=1 Tax=Trichonephila clavata TaxID=2740835 RepID=A0A8X6HVG6_TRICU|nr:hypothetical protein TNCT_138681 [Trichonephila clavata]
MPYCGLKLRKKKNDEMACVQDQKTPKVICINLLVTKISYKLVMQSWDLRYREFQMDVQIFSTCCWKMKRWYKGHCVVSLINLIRLLAFINFATFWVPFGITTAC